MKTVKLTLIFINLIWLTPCFAQKVHLDSLEHIVYDYNNNFKYEKSIELLSDLLSDKRYSRYERYTFYLYKSYTYKRLYSYPQALMNLDLALKEGLKSSKKMEVSQTIKAEKSFIYFDTQDFKKAKELMNELRELGYSNLEPRTRSFILLQEASIHTDEKDYEEADRKIDYAIKIAERESPHDLPLFYGKKFHLYNLLNKYELRDSVFKVGYDIADEYGILKYKMYLYDIAKREFQRNRDYFRAFQAQKKYDSLAYEYDSVDKLGKLEVLEEKINQEKNLAEIQRQKILKYVFMITVFVLLFFLIYATWLYIVNKRKRGLMEKENQRVRSKIEQLTDSIDEKGGSKIDISQYNLSLRQVEIIRLLQKGKSNKEIASEQFISENTVKYHLKIIYDILHIDNRKQLVERL